MKKKKADANRERIEMQIARSPFLASMSLKVGSEMIERLRKYI